MVPSNDFCLFGKSMIYCIEHANIFERKRGKKLRGKEREEIHSSIIRASKKNVGYHEGETFEIR